MKAIYLSEFSSTASAYGQIIVFMQMGEELKELHRRVSSVLEVTRVGSVPTLLSIQGYWGYGHLKTGLMRSVQRMKQG
jgi:hypothetical protein